MGWTGAAASAPENAGRIAVDLSEEGPDLGGRLDLVVVKLAGVPVLPVEGSPPRAAMCRSLAIPEVDHSASSPRDEARRSTMVTAPRVRTVSTRTSWSAGETARSDRWPRPVWNADRTRRSAYSDVRPRVC